MEIKLRAPDAIDATSWLIYAPRRTGQTACQKPGPSCHRARCTPEAYRPPHSMPYRHRAARPVAVGRRTSTWGPSRGASAYARAAVSVSCAARATNARSITSPAAAKSCSRADRRADSTRCVRQRQSPPPSRVQGGSGTGIRIRRSDAALPDSTRSTCSRHASTSMVTYSGISEQGVLSADEYMSIIKLVLINPEKSHLAQ